MENFNKYSGVISLVTSLLTVAYLFGHMSTEITNIKSSTMKEHAIVDLIKDAVKKEREISDSRYYIRPEIAAEYLTKEQFKEYMDLYMQTAHDYVHIYNRKYDEKN